jgi:uncharacterized protein YebE (UPF0316 family)
MLSNLMQSDLWAWVIMPILIFMGRTLDMSLTTLRGMLAARGVRDVVPFLAFGESLVWILVVSTIIKHLDSPLCYVAFAAGFAMGTFVGMRIEARLAIGTVLVRVITNEHPKTLLEHLHTHNWGVTVIAGEGYTGSAYILFSVVKRKDVPEVLSAIKHFYPQAFYTTEDIKMATGNIR